MMDARFLEYINLFPSTTLLAILSSSCLYFGRGGGLPHTGSYTSTVLSQMIPVFCDAKLCHWASGS
jgi:hypothetical protein